MEILPLALIKYPDPTLFKKSEPVELTEEVKEFIKALKLFYRDGLTWGNPVGLAAPQLGKNWRVFIALGEVFINPEIVWTPKAGNNIAREGCYSLEEKAEYIVSRPYSVKLQWIDINGQKYEKRFNDFPARVILHEFDHLEGRLCCGETADKR